MNGLLTQIKELKKFLLLTHEWILQCKQLIRQCLFNYRDKLKIVNSSTSVEVPFFKRYAVEGNMCVLAIYMHVRDCRAGLFIEFLIFPTLAFLPLSVVFLCAWRMRTIGIYHFGKLWGLTGQHRQHLAKREDCWHTRLFTLFRHSTSLEFSQLPHKLGLSVDEEEMKKSWRRCWWSQSKQI